MSPNMSSRSSSHGSHRQHDEPLLPFGNGGSAFDRPSLLLRIRSVLSRNLVRRVLLWVVASIVLVSIILYTKTPVSLYDVAATHHQGQSESPGEGLPGDGKAGVEDASPGYPQVNVDHDSDRPDESDNSDTAGAPEEPEDDEQSQEAHDPPAGQANDKGDDSSKPDAQDGWGLVVPGDEDDDDEDSEESQKAKKQYQEDLKRNPWLKFKHLDGYYHGVKTLVNKSDHFPEYPNSEVTDAPLPEPQFNQEIPHAKPFNPYDFTPEEVQECFLDPNNTIAAPDIFAYEGVPQHFPDPVMGSYSVLGVRDDVCFDRHGRYGPYGLGYSKNKGGAGVGQDTERKDTDYIWEKTGQIDYTEVDWSDAQKRCYESNQNRFKQVDRETDELEKSSTKIGRTAVVIRSYTGFKWTDHAILNFRALINEVSLKSAGEMDVHILVQVRDTDVPVWSDDVTVQRLLDANVPPEFHGLATLWSEPQMRLYYPGKFDDAYSNPSGRDIHGVYRSGHFPLQIFAMQHPEYEHFWNWEMDMRVLGSYYEIFHRMAEWAKTEARPMIWERAARYYIPSYHGSWEEFSRVVQQDTVRSGLSTPFGPLKFSGRKSLRFEAKGQSVMPENCDAHSDRKLCGVGEDADIITLNPIFDTDQSGWFFGLDAVGYGSTPPPRRAAIITASRISRRLLMAMHEEVWRHHHTMFSEMFPASVAFHHGFKAVFAPHPIYLDRAWYPIGESQDAAFNGGRDHSTSGHGSPFDIANEHNHKGSSWYFNSEFSGLFWRRWLGYIQKDGRGKFGGRVNDGHDRGGKKEEESDESSGRLCSRSMVLHPIKWEHPNDPR